MQKRPRCIFMGTPELAVPTLRRLHTLADISCVVTQPDRPAGRGRHLRPSPVKQAALDLNLQLWQPETLRGQHTAPQLQDADFFIVMAYGEILRQPVLDLPKQECVNVHCSLLPRWRGASPLQACLRAGDRESGVSIMRMVRALDAGPVFLRHAFPLDDQMTLAQLHDRLALCGAEALEEFFMRWPDVQAEEQDASAVTYCGKLNSDDGHLDFTLSAADIERWVRAYTPAPGCWAMADGLRLRIQQVCQSSHKQSGLKPGSVVVVDNSLCVACADGLVEIKQLQPQGKRSMPARDFLNGHSLPAVLV